MHSAGTWLRRQRLVLSMFDLVGVSAHPARSKGGMAVADHEAAHWATATNAASLTGSAGGSGGVGQAAQVCRCLGALCLMSTTC